jgi:predicted ArsR family transcriptional regulator
MISKTKAINVLFTQEMDTSVIALSKNLGVSKSKTIRHILMDYLVEHNLIDNSRIKEYYL